MHSQSGLTDIPDSDAVLQSLVSTLAPGESASAEIPSKEDVSKLPDKLKQLLGDVDPPAGTVGQRNENGDVCVCAGTEWHRSERDVAPECRRPSNSRDY